MVIIANELKQTAIINKYSLRNSFLNLPINNEVYKFKISGIGSRTIKLEKFFYYHDIIKSVQSGNNLGFEFLIEQIVINPNKMNIPILDNSLELKERALANKENLKKQFLYVYIGNKEYEFRIAGIGNRSIKLEIYVSYEDIARELNSGNVISLEFLLKEKIVGNIINYEDFYGFEPKLEINNSKIDNEEHEDNIIIQKLPEDKSKQLINSIGGLQKLIFDAINEIEDDTFKINDVLSQNLIKSYQIKKDIVLNNIEDLIVMGIIKKIDDEIFAKLW